MKARVMMLVLLSLGAPLGACSKASPRKSVWEGYDYSRGAARDNDADYVAPRVTSCVDDSPGCQ